jgi:hypothetical protein
MSKEKALCDLLGLNTETETFDGWGGDEQRLVFVSRTGEKTAVPEMDERFLRLLLRKLNRAKS